MLQHWVDTITIEDINKEAASLLSFASHYGTEAELLEEAAQDPEKFAPPGPTRTTAIVACFPAFTDPSGESIGVTHDPCSNPSVTSDLHILSFCGNVQNFASVTCSIYPRFVGSASVLLPGSTAAPEELSLERLQQALYCLASNWTFTFSAWMLVWADEIAVQVGLLLCRGVQV